MMVEAADFKEDDHVAVGGCLHASRRRRIFREREMGPRSVIVGKVAGQDSPQVLLAEYDHVIQAVAPD